MSLYFNEVDELCVRAMSVDPPTDDSTPTQLRAGLRISLREIERLRQELTAREDAHIQALSRVEDLEADLNTPRIADFLEAVKLEALHQRSRWPSEHDTGKADADWFWLLGYLAGKAIRPDCEPDKKLHHIITTAAACLNWHAHATGLATQMRPGTEAPTGVDHG